MVNGKRLFCEVIDEVWHRGNLGFLRQAYSPAFVGNTPRRKLQDLAAYRRHVTAARAAFPDVRIDVLSQLAEAELVAHRYRVRGTHNGEFMGIPASRRPISVEGITIHRLARGRIAESWSTWDVVGLLADLGADPTARRHSSRRPKGGELDA